MHYGTIEQYLFPFGASPHPAYMVELLNNTWISFLHFCYPHTGLLFDGWNKYLWSIYHFQPFMFVLFNQIPIYFWYILQFDLILIDQINFSFNVFFLGIKQSNNFFIFYLSNQIQSLIAGLLGLA